MTITEVLAQIDKLNHRAAHLRSRAEKIENSPVTLDASDEGYLTMELERAFGSLKTLQTLLSYMFRPITETGRLWKNGSGQYETTKGHCYYAGSPVEILVPDKFDTGLPYWVRTYMKYDGKDYYAAGYPELQLKGLTVRVREGDEP